MRLIHTYTCANGTGYGSHYGCSKLSISDAERETAINVLGDNFSFNASYYTQEELMAKAHNFEIDKSGDVVLCLDGYMSGSGSGSCGPQQFIERYQCNDEYLVISIFLGNFIDIRLIALLCIRKSRQW